MSAWQDMATRLFGLTKAFNLMEERHTRQAEDIKAVREELWRVRDRMHEIDKRVAVLEEGRKTTAAEVKAPLIETIAVWEIARAKEEAQSKSPSRRGIAKKESDTQ